MSMSLLLRFSVLWLALCVAALPAHAQRAEGIAAVVNDEIITTTDLKDRSEMLLRSAGQTPNAGLMQKVAPVALEGLISEAIQLQEARRLGITISATDISGGIDRIAENNNMKPEQFRNLITSQGVKLSSIERQVKAQLAWGRVIQQELRPRVIVSASEIQAERQRMLQSSGKREALAAEIFLPVSSAADAAKIRTLANNLHAELKKGRRFSDIARQHSASASAAQGGMIGWVREGQLEPALDAALFAIGKNEATPPIKGEDGFYILFKRDERSAGVKDPNDAILTLRELVIDTSGMRSAEAETMASRLARDLTGCIDISKRAAGNKSMKIIERKVTLNDLTDSERTRLAPYTIGQAGKPEIGENRATISMVCARTDPTGNVASDEAVERTIGLRRLDMLQKRYLRDLIASSFVERRV